MDGSDSAHHAVNTDLFGGLDLVTLTVGYPESQHHLKPPDTQSASGRVGGRREQSHLLSEFCDLRILTVLTCR